MKTHGLLLLGLFFCVNLCLRADDWLILRIPKSTVPNASARTNMASGVIEWANSAENTNHLSTNAPALFEVVALINAVAAGSGSSFNAQFGKLSLTNIANLSNFSFTNIPTAGSNIVIGIASGAVTYNAILTPWQSDYDAAGFGLSNISKIKFSGGLMSITNGTTRSLMIGGADNFVDTSGGGVGQAVVGGSFNSNQSSADGAGIFVGVHNTISTQADFSGIFAGTNNTINSANSFVGGGGGITILSTNGSPDNGYNGAIGGFQSLISGRYSAAVAGFRSYVYGNNSGVFGGRSNFVSGDSSVAMGADAHVTHSGVFMWSDDQGRNFSSTRSNQFAIRAKSGIMLMGSTNDLTQLHFIVATNVPASDQITTAAGQNGIQLRGSNDVLYLDIASASAFVGVRSFPIVFPQTLSAPIDTVSNDATAETSLHFYAIPQNTFASVGDSLSVFYAGKFGNTANTKKIRFYCAGFKIFENAATAYTADWVFRATLQRANATDLRYSISLLVNTNVPLCVTGLVNTEALSGGFDATTEINLTGESSAASSDISLYFGKVRTDQ